MYFIKASPSEYLVVGHGGKITNHGIAAHVFIWPGWSYVRVPSIQQEALFEMTQESQDGIPLRFKGIVIFRVVNPEVATRLFNFSDPSGLQELRGQISHICLGELRAIVSQMTMKQCIEERKTTLTDAIKHTLQEVIDEPEKGWGIALDVVQVAQVFIVDNELRRQLEAEVRNEIKSKSERAELQAQEAIKLAKIVSERRVQREDSETETQRVTMQRESIRLQQELERDRIETQTPVQLLKIEKQMEIYEAEKQMRELENQVKTLEVENSMIHDRARQNLRKEILPLEQLPVVAESVSHIFQGSNLSLYGEGAPLLATLAPLIEFLTKNLNKDS